MKRSSKRIPNFLLIFIMFAFCVFITMITIGLIFYLPPTPQQNSIPTPDNRPKISGCLSWKYLEVSDYAKTLCVYGYPSFSKHGVSLGLYVEFYTKPKVGNSYNWKDEGRPYIVQLAYLDPEVREVYDKDWWFVPQGETVLTSKCVAVTGEIWPFHYEEEGRKYQGFYINVKNLEAMRVLSNCE